jgi:hypothetical protein
MKYKTSLKSRALFWLLTNAQAFTQFYKSGLATRIWVAERINTTRPSKQVREEEIIIIHKNK